MHGLLNIEVGQRWWLHRRCAVYIDDGKRVRMLVSEPGFPGIVMGREGDRVKLNIGHDRVASVEPWRLRKFWSKEQ